ncbi:MAG: YceH family protein [Acidobacteria bacterium]|nr:YceH family protein [Acidobacteriota bacterium]MBV9476177.1 YceH family protein [Acidobacteriota bacterium]
MTFIPTLDTTSKQRPRIPRTLDPVEIRILGSLMEKQLATPEYYPLTLNALVAACNQKSNREPVMELGESEVERALDRLQDEKLVWRVMGGRAVRFDHNLDNVWHLNRREKALLTLLFLRGPQTSGELRGRSDRLQSFETVAEVEETLRDMATHSEPLVRELTRRPGQKEERWAHLVGGAIVEDAPAPAAAPESSRATSEPLSARVLHLEEQVAELARELRELKAKLGE